MPYEINLVVRVYDEVESDEHKKLVRRVERLQSNLAEVCGLANADIEVNDADWIGEDEEPEEWTLAMEGGLRYVLDAAEHWEPGTEPDEASTVNELMDSEGLTEAEALLVVAEIKEREEGIDGG